MPRTTLLLLLAGALVGCGAPPPAAVTDPLAALPELGEPAAKRPSRESEYAYHLPGLDCLVDENGILRKVLVIQRGVRATPRPGAGVETGHSLKFFFPYYVFAVVADDENGPEHYQIGSTPRRESILGWVGRDVVAPWDNVVGVRLAGKTPLLVYPTLEAVQERVTTGSTKTPPLARAHFSSRTHWMPWPVVATQRIPHAGKTYEALHIHFLGKFAPGGALATETADPTDARYTPQEIEQIKQGIRRIDLVFCCDNTASTRPFMDAIRAAILRIAREVGATQGVKLRVGLVLYRDYVPGILFPGDRVTFLEDLTEDLDEFCRRIAQMTEATEGSAGLPEAVYDGVDAALTQASWSDDLLTTRALILIGDNSAHEPGSSGNPRGLTRQDLAAQARTQHVPIFALSVDGRGDEQERSRHRDQFRALAEDSGGEFHRLDDAERVVAQVRQITEQHARTIKDRIRGVDQLTGDSPNPSTETHAPEMSDEEISAVMEFLTRAGIDPSRLAQGPAFSSGWILTETPEGARLVESYHYLARGELDMLNGELHHLALVGSPDLGRKLLQTKVGSALDPRSYFAVPARLIPMDIYLQSQQIPCPNGILTLTREEIDHMSEEARVRLANRIHELLPELTRLRNDNQVFRNIGDGVDMGWIRTELLP